MWLPSPELNIPQADRGGIAGARQATPEEAHQLYQEEVAAQRKPRNIVDTAEGTITLPISSKVQAVGTMTNNMARMEHAADQDRGVVTVGSTSRPDYRALEKLGLAEGAIATSGKVSSAKARPKQAFGGASYIAMLLALNKISAPEEQSEYIGEGETKTITRGSTAIHKISFFDDVAAQLEKLVNPTPEGSVDPATGEATAAGYESQLDSLEKTSLGDMIFRMAAETGLVQDNYNGDNPNALLKKKTGTKEGVETYVLTEAGAKLLRSGPVSAMLSEIAPGTKRNVSLTPVRQGQFVGEAATEQKSITDVPDASASVLSPMMVEAMDVIGTTPYIVVEHNMEMASDFLTDIQETQQRLEQAAQQQAQQTGRPVKEVMAELAEQPEFQSEFHDLFDVGYARQAKIERDSIKGAKHKRGIRYNPVEKQWYDAFDVPYNERDNEMLTATYAQDIADNPEFESVHEFAPEKRMEDARKHDAYAATVIKMAIKKMSETVGDARNRAGYKQNKQTGMWDKTGRGGQVFYYGSTAIGNSGRIMISNTELNWQSNKLARFIVGNPIATRVEIENGQPSRAFKYVVARAMLDGADLLTQNALLQRMDDVRKDIDPVARQLYGAMQMPQGPERRAALSAAMKSIRNNDNFDQDQFEGTGEWGFIVDAIHEWGRFLDAKDNKRGVFHTRVRAEGDGINNGSSIQGLQFGDMPTLERAGLVYEYDAPDVTYDEQGNPIYKSVTPQGNMRDYTMGRLFNAQREGTPPGEVTDRDFNAEMALFGVKEEMHERVSELMPKIMRNGTWRKKFIKIPLMTTIYGKPADMHKDAANAFLAKHGGDLEIDPEEYGALATAFQKVIGNALRDALNDPLVHQSLVKKQAGWLFNIMDVVPKVKGPNGYVWQAGGDFWLPHPEIKPRGSGDKTRYLLDTTYHGQSPEFERTSPQSLGTGTKDRFGGSVTARVPVPSAGARKATTEQDVKQLKKKREQLAEAKKAGNEKLMAKHQKSIEYLESKIADWGEMTRNQLAVNGTHNIDSTVAQKTLIDTKKKMGDKFWGGQVFDAFIGDVSSFEKIMDEGNKVFLDVNRDFNIIQSEYDAFQEGVKEFNKRMDELGDQPLDIRDNSNAQFRAVSAFIKKFGASGTANKSFKGGYDAWMSALDDFNVEVKQKQKNNIPQVVTTHMTAKDLKGFVHWMRNNFLSPPDVVVDDNGALVPRELQADTPGITVDSAFQRNINRVQKAKDKFYSEYRDRLAAGRQFN